MGHRLSKIYTRTGDTGKTGLGDGSRTAKDDARIEAIGDIDELNCSIGLLITTLEAPEFIELFVEVQHDLFDLGGELCIPGHTSMQQCDVTRLENTLDQYNENLAPLKEFILPGGSLASSQCHLSRAICRRAERRLITLQKQSDVNPVALQYVNRLSDLLFVLARQFNLEHGDVLWKPRRHD